MNKPRLTPVMVRYLSPEPALFWVVSGELPSPDGSVHQARSNLRRTPEAAWQSFQAIVEHYAAFWAGQAHYEEGGNA